MEITINFPADAATLDLGKIMQRIAALLDGELAANRRRFEDSLIANHAPSADLEDLLRDQEAYLTTWRAAALATIERALLVEMSS